MTLLDAPTYDPAKARMRKNILIAEPGRLLVLAGLLWFFWDWPQEHRVNQFFAAIEAKDLPKAFGIWNHDPDWQQHPQQYAQYPYGRFEMDWGHSSDWGDIKTHKIMMSKTVAPGWWSGWKSTDKRRPSSFGWSAATRRLASPRSSFRPTRTGQQFFQAGGIFHLRAFLAAVNLPHQPAEHLARTDLDKVGYAFGDEQLHGLCPTNRAGDLADQCIAQRCGVGRPARHPR